MQNVERKRPLAGTRCRGEYYIKLELSEIGRRGLLDTSGSGRAPLLDRHEYVDEGTVSIKGNELLDQLISSRRAVRVFVSSNVIPCILEHEYQSVREIC